MSAVPAWIVCPSAWPAITGWPRGRPGSMTRHRAHPHQGWADDRPEVPAILAGTVPGTVRQAHLHEEAASATLSTPSVPCDWRRRSVGEPGLKIRRASSAASSGMCEWPNMTSSASGNQARILGSRPAAGPLSWIVATRGPSDASEAVSAAPQAATSGRLLLADCDPSHNLLSEQHTQDNKFFPQPGHAPLSRFRAPIMCLAMASRAASGSPATIALQIGTWSLYMTVVLPAARTL
jgi:hypothetical protein